MTAFYVLRAMFMTFFGEYRGHEHPHESPAVMWVPLVVLAVLSLVGGWLFNIPEFLKAMFPAVEEAENPMLMYISVAAGFAGIALAYLMYVVKPGMADSLAQTFKAPYNFVYNKYFVDEIYDAAVVNPLVGGSRVVLWKGVDAGPDRWHRERRRRARPRRGQRAAPAAIRQHPQLRHLGAVRLRGSDRGHGPLREVCPDEPPDPGPLPAAGRASLIALAIPRSLPRRAAACGR